MVRIAFLGLVLIALGIDSGRTQDIAGIEDCTKTAGLDKRTGCLQSNLNFLQRLVIKNALEAAQRLKAAEAEIIALKVPGLDEKLRRQVARFVGGLRKLDVKKAPSIAETLDWARALLALGVRELDAPTVRRTLNLVLK